MPFHQNIAAVIKFSLALGLSSLNNTGKDTQSLEERRQSKTGFEPCMVVENEGCDGAVNRPRDGAPCVSAVTAKGLHGGSVCPLH